MADAAHDSLFDSLENIPFPFMKCSLDCFLKDFLKIEPVLQNGKSKIKSSQKNSTIKEKRIVIFTQLLHKYLTEYDYSIEYISENFDFWLETCLDCVISLLHHDISLCKYPNTAIQIILSLNSDKKNENSLIVNKIGNFIENQTLLLNSNARNILDTMIRCFPVATISYKSILQNIFYQEPSSSWESIWNSHLKDIKLSLTQFICDTATENEGRNIKLSTYLDIHLSPINFIYNTMGKIVSTQKYLRQICPFTHALLNSVLYFISIFSQIVETNFIPDQEPLVKLCLIIFEYAIRCKNTLLIANSLECIEYIYQSKYALVVDDMPNLWNLINIEFS
ncbi:hypothetical protein MXB_5139, partial [Myxobolus squamalis]